MQIPFNKPYLTGKELKYIKNAVNIGKISGNGYYTAKCHQYFKERYNFKNCLLTTSCTDALEMAAILCNIQPGDEVIVPSYTFVSTANAFVLRGAKIVFVDSKPDHPCMDESKIEALITVHTKAIVPVHYAGVACNMDVIMSIAKKYDLFVVEDAAQAIDSFYKNKPLGGIGHFGCFSFHETKNIQCGEGGLLTINDERFIKRAEIIWEKGTNRAEFFRGEVSKYNWVDIGSSFLPSEISAAFLYAQLEYLDNIQERRKLLWEQYQEWLLELEIQGYFKLPTLHVNATNNAHAFYLICNSITDRTNLINVLKENKVLAVFHYIGLHNSEFYKNKHDNSTLPNCDHFTDCLLRLPLYYDLESIDIRKISNLIKAFYC